MKTILAIAAYVLLALPAAAHTTAAPAAQTALYTEASAAGETLDAFATRIAARAVFESLRVSGEICGEFRAVGDGYEIEFYTIRHQQQCSYMRGAGTYTGVTYHTHIFIGLANHHLQRQKELNPRFSEADYSHPGYMTTGPVTLHHAGTRASVRRVSSR